jgi:hypothetical protein
MTAGFQLAATSQRQREYLRQLLVSRRRQLQAGGREAARVPLDATVAQRDRAVREEKQTIKHLMDLFSEEEVTASRE